MWLKRICAIYYNMVGRAKISILPAMPLHINKLYTRYAFLHLYTILYYIVYYECVYYIYTMSIYTMGYITKQDTILY
jgi:hypothetical protein